MGTININTANYADMYMENLTAQQLIVGLSAIDWQIFAINLVVFLLGALANVSRRMLTNNVSFYSYWSKHKYRSMASVITLLVSFLALITADTAAPLYAFFSIAYMSDSMMNKSPDNGGDNR